LATNIKGVTGLTGRYASALFDLADENNVLDDVAKDLSFLQELIEESDDLSRMIKSPIISRDDQTKSMMAILDKGKFSNLTKKFIGVISSNRRLFALRGIIEDYLTILSNKRGEVTADVVSAVPLSKDQEVRMLEKLDSVVPGEVSLRLNVDPGLLGGLVVKIGSRMVDSSVSSKLQRLRLAMRGIG
tara:strand:+ start:1859 stop:2419 length:561 start_codon:yes stop_codon:yes gene_type:complete